MWDQSSTRHDEIADGLPIECSAVGTLDALPRFSSPASGDRSRRVSLIDSGGSSRDAGLIGNAIPTSIWSARHDGSIAFINGEGRPSTQAVDDPNGSDWLDAIHPDDRSRARASWSSSLRSGRPFHDVHRAKGHNGRYQQFLVDAVAIRSEEGHAVCWIGAKTAIGEPEAAHAEPLPRRNHSVLAGPGGLSQTRGESRNGVAQSFIGRATSGQLIYLDPKAARRIGDPEPSADAARRAPPANGRNSTVGSSILEAVSAAAEAALADSPQCLDPKLFRDSRIKALAEGLPEAGRIPTELAGLYSHTLCVAVLARICGSRLHARMCVQRRPIAELPKWRLARVNQYIDAHMDEPIRLENLAKAAGLTRMHFAAQFRAAVGICPHEYLLRQRIRRAQTLLRDSGQRLVDVALSVGFQAQPHFTTVFRRYVGESPHRWRLSQGGAGEANLGALSQGASSRC